MNRQMTPVETLRRCSMCGGVLVEDDGRCRTFRGKRYHSMQCPTCLHQEIVVEVIRRDE